MFKFRFNDPGVMGHVQGLILGIIGVAIALVVFGSLVGVSQSAITNASLTGAAGTLAPLVTLVYVAGVVIAVLGIFLFYFAKR